MYIVATGDPFNGGYNFYGPFNRRQEAADWAEEYNSTPWWIVELTPPGEAP